MFENAIPDVINLNLYDDDNRDEAVILTAITEDCEVRDTIVTLEFICRAPVNRVLTAAPLHKPFSREPLKYRLLETCEKIHEEDEFCILLFKHYEDDKLTCMKSTICIYESLYI